MALNIIKQSRKAFDNNKEGKKAWEGIMLQNYKYNTTMDTGLLAYNKKKLWISSISFIHIHNEPMSIGNLLRKSRAREAESGSMTIVIELIGEACFVTCTDSNDSYLAIVELWEKVIDNFLRQIFPKFFKFWGVIWKWIRCQIDKTFDLFLK